VVPLLAMLRHRAGAGSHVPTALVYSSRTREDVIAFDELAALAAADPALHVLHTLTRSQPPGWQGYARRIDRDMLTNALRPLGGTVQAFICGPTLLVEAAAEALVDLGLRPAQIKTERFGPTGA
jgi:ferredoxin-NADP reductase